MDLRPLQILFESRVYAAFERIEWRDRRLDFGPTAIQKLSAFCKAAIGHNSVSFSFDF
jgi:hypothetical protein